MKRIHVLICAGLLGLAVPAFAGDGPRTVVVTSSNAAENQLLVYDTRGVLLESVPTLGAGGVENNAGGIAADGATVAVVNFTSRNVSVFEREHDGGHFVLRDVVPTVSQPVSVAFGKDHLYVLGTTTVESHRLERGSVENVADGVVGLLAADGSAGQVGVTANGLIITEKSGTVEVVDVRAGRVIGHPQRVAIPADTSDTPFGLVTRGSAAYVTIAHSDVISLVRRGTLQALVATGVVGGEGQHSPCWLALAGPYLFSSNSPSHSITRLVAAGNTLTIDAPVAATTNGAPIDIAATSDLIALIEADGAGAAHVTQFRITDGGDLEKTASTAIAAAANGVAIVSGR